MAHAISFGMNGAAEMAFVGETPWHGLGARLQEGADLDTWAHAAGMEWKVQRSKVRYATATEQDITAMQEWPDRHVLFRSDSKAPLGVVSDGYKIVQPRQVLEFFAHVAEENKIQLHTAGVLNGGRQYWALAKTGQDFKLAGIDRVAGYVLLATSADGSLATTAKPTTVRVVCSNTLAMSMGDGHKAIRVKHSTHFNAQQVRIDLGMMGEGLAEFEQTAARLASKRLTKQAALQVLIRSIGDAEAFAEAFKEQQDFTLALAGQPNVRQMGEIIALFDGKGRGAQSITSAGTAWGLVNAATEYYDHFAGRGPDSRLQSAWFGVNDSRKSTILAEAIAEAA